jgi:hypothetical protein
MIDDRNYTIVYRRSNFEHNFDAAAKFDEAPDDSGRVELLL